MHGLRTVHSVVVVWEAGYERLSWGIVEILCLLTDAIMALILETTLDTSETWAFVALELSVSTSNPLKAVTMTYHM